MAFKVARLLAVYERQPIAGMVRDFMELFTVGPMTDAAVQVAGRHIATVYRSGHVQYKGLP